MLLPLLLSALAPAGDDDLMRRMAAGDPSALRSTYDRTAGTVLALALRILGARPEAEEVVQETFLELWRRAPAYDPRRGSAVAWILSICRSRAIDRIRSRGVAARVAQSAAAEGDPVAMPIENTEARQRRERVQEALLSLPAEQREAIELAYFGGLTQREIAQRTGEPLGTVKTRVRLALAKLSGLLREVAP
jgi:RNA polymerase sigma-70 factor (ECF subfamily)